MEVPLLLQFAIALFTGMVAATLVPPIRKAIPRPVEVLLWVALVTACALGIMSVTDKGARDVSMAALWGGEQVVNTVFGLLLMGVGGWIHEQRFAIASSLTVVAGADLLALILIRSMRAAAGWTPRVRLRDWMELPPAAPAVPVRRQAAEPSRLAAAPAVLASTAHARSLELAAFLRGVMSAQAERAREVESHSRLESLREATAHLRFAARAWLEGAGQPAVSNVAAKATGAARAARRGLGPAAERAGHVVDIRALLGPQSLGLYGQVAMKPVDASRREIEDEDSQRPDSMAS